ncbi:MAG TPA: hypothetical protein VI731_07410 [Bacteroidia bacterium]|nr:hypothetical protein [Bacteroidia bacterium]
MQRRYDLSDLENEYRRLTALGETLAAERIRAMLASMRYDLRMEAEVILEYREGLEEPLVMRVLRTEKDLDRWVTQRFARLEEFQ